VVSDGVGNTAAGNRGFGFEEIGVSRLEEEKGEQ